MAASSGTLIGKLAFVTGAGSGIGRATCKILAREGASVIAGDRNANTAEETVTSLVKESNQNHLFLDLDVGDQSSVKGALSKVLEQYKKPPNIIVNNAGITRDNFLLKLSIEDFDEVIKVNLKGTFLVTQVFANALVEHKLPGSIVNIASTTGKYGNIGQSNYAASKAGVEGFTKTAAKEFGKFGIRVNSVLPGMIATPMTDVVPEKVKAKVIPAIPLQRLGKPEEVGEVIAFLASDRSSYVTGAIYDVHGGV